MIACGPLPFLDGTVGHTCTVFQMSNIDKPKKVLGFDEDGDNLIERSKYSKVKSITNIEEWSEDFFNYIKILLKRFPALANDLISYMSIIRSAVPLYIQFIRVQ
jgi:hypothetical protein